VQVLRPARHAAIAAFKLGAQHRSAAAKDGQQEKQRWDRAYPGR